MKNKGEKIIGFLGLAAVLVFGASLGSEMLFFRLLVGMLMGYSLTRSYAGFAGSVNRACNTGSTKLMRVLMVMFFLTAMATAAFLMVDGPENFKLKINPINLGLIIGGALFGFGMSLSACCASGVLTDLVTGLPRAIITLFFFTFGVFIGFPMQKTWSIAKSSCMTSPTGAASRGGVFLPDLFKWDGMNGYLGALILTGLLAALVIYLSYRYEQKCRLNKSYCGVPSERFQEEKQEETVDVENYALNEKVYYRIFEKPWTLAQGGIGMAIAFLLLMGVTKAGWGVSSPFGIWFGKLLMLFGVSADAIANFTHMSASAFTKPILEHGSSLQNIGIILGTIFYLLSAGLLKKMFFSEFSITGKQMFIYALGGITMGVGTRLAHGCNAGALYTPISQLSLSGWVFLIVMVTGGVLGSKFGKKFS